MKVLQMRSERTDTRKMQRDCVKLVDRLLEE